MKPLLLTGLAAALALSACTNKSNDEATSNTTVAVEATPSAAPTTTAAPTTPQGFVDAAASSDMYEIEAGKLAQQMGHGENVKAFGAMMVKDHTASSKKLKDAVGQAGNGLSVPIAMAPAQQSQLDALKNAGDSFDMTYAQQQVAAHQAALTLLTDQSNSGTVPQLKSFAAGVLPVVQHHYDEAKKLP
jgi:putative membrane protein